jgi:hypothetical protein
MILIVEGDTETKTPHRWEPNSIVETAQGKQGKPEQIGSPWVSWILSSVEG